jgi:hypothetical protein
VTLLCAGAQRRKAIRGNTHLSAGTGRLKQSCSGGAKSDRKEGIGAIMHANELAELLASHSLFADCETDELSDIILRGHFVRYRKGQS